MRSAFDRQWVALSCSTIKDASHFFQTPYLQDVINEVELFNKGANDSGSTFNLPSSEGPDDNNGANSGRCQGVNGLRASGHRGSCLKRCPNQLCQQCCRHMAKKVCSHHRDRNAGTLELSTLSKPTPSSVFNTAPTRILAPLPIRRTVNRPTQSAQADRAVLKDLSQDALTHYNNERRRTQNEKDGMRTRDLELQVWLKADRPYLFDTHLKSKLLFIAINKVEPGFDLHITQLTQS
ncbi:uncharacterized protein MELLADRAFT_107696 [Melampsora larici-populina 98AG31]|uniref:Uncharacterized protein n=1 Tax=Melampsora larici-populina (strain 98AG31 / pathotype 3-4-7) TaxID=747676 RepID=F4RQG9_MELLP|nr:uncharacterized protein MELLADRAFT_107696 [Melampsora larici-populina 98AG31]EGG05412.1 hypothetical protein MELLADRAFT_107696 [Melampsora larici-populina 98AG31]